MMTEEEIVEGCCQGDNASRRELYLKYGGKMLAVGMRYLADKEAAEDVLHDVFLRVFSSLKKFDYRGEGSLLAWLSRIMVNASLEHIRKDRHADLVPIENIKDDIPDETIDVQLLSQGELMRLIEELPIGYRTVLNLFVFERKSHKEIAELLGINEKSSSSQFFRAKTLLKKKISDYLKTTDRDGK